MSAKNKEEQVSRFSSIKVSITDRVKLKQAGVNPIKVFSLSLIVKKIEVTIYVILRRKKTVL